MPPPYAWEIAAEFFRVKFCVGDFDKLFLWQDYGRSRNHTEIWPEMVFIRGSEEDRSGAGLLLFETRQEECFWRTDTDGDAFIRNGLYTEAVFP